MARVALLSRLAAGAAFIAVPLTLLTGVSASGCAMLHARTIGPPLETPLSLAKQGNIMGQSQDNVIYVPLTLFKSHIAPT